MTTDILLAFCIALGVGIVLWCLTGLLVMPVFGAQMVTLCYAKDDAPLLEQQVRSYGWLREGKLTGGRLVIVDSGLTEQGRTVAEKLSRRYAWITLYSGSIPPSWMPENEQNL